MGYRLAHFHAVGTAEWSCADGVAQQIGQLVRIVMELLGVRLVLAHQIDGDREGARHILIIGAWLLVAAVQLIVDGAGPEHLRLQRDGDGNLFSLAHIATPH